MITQSEDRSPSEQRTVSLRKVEANRQNALKSTGPKTARGKAFSRRNALKHGLFARDFIDFHMQGEDPAEYEELLNGLWNDYQPIGSAEELEVERIALCWWRLKRAWRYENASNRVALRDGGWRELEKRNENCKLLDEEEKAVILQLQSAEEEIEVIGEISRELREKLFATMPRLKTLWPAIEAAAQKMLDSPAWSKKLRNSSAEERASALAVATAIIGVSVIEELAQWRSFSILELTVAQHAIPNGEALDKVLRYEAAIDRNLSRSLDRLERLQRRRRGEPVLPSVSVHLTQ